MSNGEGVFKPANDYSASMPAFLIDRLKDTAGALKTHWVQFTMFSPKNTNMMNLEVPNASKNITESVLQAQVLCVPKRKPGSTQWRRPYCH